MRAQICALAALVIVAVGCGGGSSPATPSPTPTPTPTPSVINLLGTVQSQAGANLIGGTVRIMDGPNQGKTALVDATGQFILSGLTAANANVSAVADGYEEQRKGVYINGSNTLAFTLRTLAPWRATGTGDNVLTIPSYVTRLNVRGDYNGRCQNFVVRVRGLTLVNVIIGTCSVADTPTPFVGTYQIAGGGTAEITISTGVTWTLTEVR